MPLTIAAIVLVLAIIGLTYMGAFRDVQVTEAEAGPFFLAYQHSEETSFGRVRDVTTNFNALFDELKLTGRKPAQVFHPDGSADIGFVLNEFPTESVRETLEAQAVRLNTIDAGQFMHLRFPFRNPMSFLFGYFKVDPALRKHRERQQYAETPALVINEGTEILYLQRIECESPG